MGTKLLDDTINIDDIIRNFIVPQELTTRPVAVLLVVEWPWTVCLAFTEQLRLTYDGRRCPIIDVDLRHR